MSSFNYRCYKLVSLIPRGKISTYKEIAVALNTCAFQAVGCAMANNPKLLVVPCHRVIKSNGSVGEYALGAKNKTNLLMAEGLPIKNGLVVNYKKFLYSFYV